MFNSVFPEMGNKQCLYAHTGDMLQVTTFLGILHYKNILEIYTLEKETGKQGSDAGWFLVECLLINSNV